MNTHPCPGGCGRGLGNGRLACPSCWRRLPAELRAEVTAAYANRRRDLRAHLDAIAEAAQWYRDNPRSRP